VAELEQRLSGLEFVEWQIFMTEEGVLPGMADVRHAELLAAHYNGAMLKKTRQAWEPREFMRERWQTRRAADATKPKLRGGKAMRAAIRGETEH
jgi:hypothetical protein